jgi:glutathione reductase (NADPH)
MITVEGRAIKGRAIVIATGARPVPLDFPGAEHAITSDAFMELEQLPERIVMIGGGYIAAEFSHIASRAGARVTVLQRATRMLPKFDADLVGLLMKKFQEIGIDVRTDNTVTAIEREEQELRVHARTSRGTVVVAADLVVHAAGRVPAIAELNLSMGHLDLEDGRLRLNEFLQSVSNPIVYAAGDAALQGLPLTPVSSHDGKVVAANIVDGNRHRPDYSGVPSVAFTLPPIASVGRCARDSARRFPFRGYSSGEYICDSNAQALFPGCGRVNCAEDILRARLSE